MYRYEDKIREIAYRYPLEKTLFNIRDLFVVIVMCTIGLSESFCFEPLLAPSLSITPIATIG